MAVMCLRPVQSRRQAAIPCEDQSGRSIRFTRLKCLTAQSSFRLRTGQQRTRGRPRIGLRRVAFQLEPGSQRRGRGNKLAVKKPRRFNPGMSRSVDYETSKNPRSQDLWNEAHTRCWMAAAYIMGSILPDALFLLRGEPAHFQHAFL